MGKLKNKAPPVDQPRWGRGNSKGARKRRRLRAAGLALDRLDRPIPSELQATERSLNYGVPEPTRKPLGELSQAPSSNATSTGTKPRKVEVIDLTHDDPRLAPRRPGWGWTRSNAQVRPSAGIPSTAQAKPTFSFGPFDQKPIGFDAAAKAVLESAAKTDLDRVEQNNQMNIFGGPANNSQVLRTTKFGQPQKPLPGFDRVVWVQQDPETLANWSPRREKSLEDLYQEYPERRLRSIEPDTLNLVAKTIQQIANEAANEWLKSSCPGTCWTDKTVNVEGLYDFNAPELDFTILDRALSLQKVKNEITSLLVNSRAMIQGSQNMTLLVLVRIMDQSIGVCQIVKDSKRRVLLQKTKEKIEWLPVGLDCKKLDIHRRAVRNLEERRSKVRKQLAQARPTKQDKGCSEVEVEVLDQALVEFQEHRLEFVVEVFNTLKQLLEATA